MLKPTKSVKLYCVSLITLALFSCASNVKPPPRVDKCNVVIRCNGSCDAEGTQVDSKRSYLLCINPQGTEYKIPLKKADKYFAAPIDHIIKLASWLKHLLKVIEKGYLKE